MGCWGPQPRRGDELFPTIISQVRSLCQGVLLVRHRFVTLLGRFLNRDRTLSASVRRPQVDAVGTSGYLKGVDVVLTGLNESGLQTSVFSVSLEEHVQLL